MDGANGPHALLRSAALEQTTLDPLGERRRDRHFASRANEQDAGARAGMDSCGERGIVDGQHTGVEQKHIRMQRARQIECHRRVCASRSRTTSLHRDRWVRKVRTQVASSEPTSVVIACRMLPLLPLTQARGR